MMCAGRIQSVPVDSSAGLSMSMISIDAFPSVATYPIPMQDKDGNLLQMEFGLSMYRNRQMLALEELHEKSPTGQLPRAVDIICEHDIVDARKLGNRVKVVKRILLPGAASVWAPSTVMLAWPVTSWRRLRHCLH